MIEWRSLWQLRHIKIVLKPYENGWKILQEHSKEGLGVSPFIEFKTVIPILMKKCCKTWNMKILWTSLRKLSYTINSRIWKRCRLRDWARCHSADPFWFMSAAHRITPNPNYRKFRPIPRDVSWLLRWIWFIRYNLESLISKLALWLLLVP